ncbi:hypothetical protein A0U92_01130 [Acetobacter aceti]|uniref:Uncharacterized protein n=1 Tax=Acetobacter aceti TaxID=435 RepID=A0A1U9KCQ9_ACEAC|nr:hypothetical protein [Acetobacter aceti]AQS83601.1 hypothetical protein A0U92_01130 [Acetobacter aceti]
MIIQSARMMTSSGPGKTCAHVFRGAKNESIEVIQGSEFQVMQDYDEAGVRGDRYAVRHFKINPQHDLSREQFLETVSILAIEFGFDPDACTIVEHTKTKASGKASKHIHLYVSERTPDGKALDSRFMKVRQEKISRTCEALFGHDIVHGRHQQAVIHQLRDEGKHDIADAIEKATPDLSQSVESAFTLTQQRIAERHGISLLDLRQRLKDLRISCDTFSGMIKQMQNMGLHVKKGDRENTYIIMTDEDKFLGSANRLLGMKKQEFSQQYESSVQGLNTKYEPVEDASSSYVPETASGKPVQTVFDENRREGNFVPKIATYQEGRLPSGEKEKVEAPDVERPAHIHPDLVNGTSETSEVMSAEEKKAIQSANHDRTQASQTIRRMLADQEEFHRKLAELEKQFQVRWGHIKSEPFPDPDSRNAFLVRQKHEGILRPRREKYRTEKEKWLNGSATRKALQEFQSALKQLRYDRDDFKNLDILNNDDHFNYSLNHMSDLYVAGRERARKEWSSDLSVQSYLKAKKDFDELLDYIKKTENVELLKTALQNPVRALQQMRELKKSEQQEKDLIYKNTGRSLMFSYDER